MQNRASVQLERPMQGSWLRSLVNQFIYFYYGNSAGLRNNFGAYSELRNLRKAFTKIDSMSFSDYGSVQANRLTENGYIVIDDLIEPTKISAAVACCKKIFQTPKMHVAEKHGAMFHAINPTEVMEFQNLFSSKLRGILENYYKCAYRINTVRVWRNIHVESADQERDDIFSNTFHHDACKATSLRVFILLKDNVNRDTGALRFHDKANSMNLIRKNYFSRYSQNNKIIERLIDPSSLKYFEGDAGDCAIVNTQECLHAASIPGLGSYRDILQFEVYADSGPIKSDEELFDIPEDQEILSLLK